MTAAQPMVIRDQVFQDRQVRLDFQRFEGCRFERCVMIFGGYGPVGFDNCQFTDVQWVFADAAQHTLAFMAALYHSGDPGRQLVERMFESVRNPPQPEPRHLA